MEELNFDEMRNQITLLKQKLDHQEIVNDQLLREVTRANMGTINWTKYKSFICVAICLVIYPTTMLYMGIFSKAFVIFTCVMVLSCAYGTYYVHRPVDRMNLMTEDLATVAKVMAKFRKQYNQWLYYVTPSLLIPWLSWAVYEYAWKDVPEGMNSWALTIPILVGAVIGLLIGYYWHRRAVNAADKIIRQIEEEN